MKKLFHPNKLSFNLLIFLLFCMLTFFGYKALLHPGMFTSQDGEGHIIRLFEFDKALNDGNFPVRWSKRLNWGLGYPYFNFNYPLTYYLTDAVHLAGLDLINSYKFMLILTFPFGGFFAFLWLKNHFDTLSSVVGGVFFVFIPYHFLNIYVRGNIAESLSISIVPLVLYLVDLLLSKPSFKNSYILGLGLSMIILFHNLTAMIFLPIIFIYGLIEIKHWSKIKYLLLSYFLALGLSAFFLIPALTQKNLIVIDQVFSKYYLNNFPSFKSLIYSPWGYGGSNVGVQNGEMSFQIGIIDELVIVLATLLLFKSKFKKINKLLLLFVSLVAVAVILMQKISIPIWRMLEILQYLQFPWRLLSVISVSVAFLAAYSYSYLSSFLRLQLKYVLAIFFILGIFFFNRNHWGVNEYYQPPNYWFTDTPYSGTTTVDGEHTPVWLNLEQTKKSGRYEIISGEGNVESKVWKTNYHLFDVTAQTQLNFADRTVYFPGWVVYIDSDKSEILDPYKYDGLIAFVVPMGTHKVEVKFEESNVDKISDLISLITLSSICLLFLRKFRIS